MRFIGSRMGFWIEKGETYPIRFRAFALSLLAVIYLRAFLEGFMERPHLIGLSGNPLLSGAAFFRHSPLFFILSFVVVVLILHLFTGVKVSSISRIALLALPIILIVPLADFLITWGKGARIYYITTFEEYRLLMLGFFIPGFRTPGASFGLRIEIIVLLILMGAYVHVKTGNAVKTLGAMLLAFCTIGSLGSVPFLVTAAMNGLLAVLGKAPVMASDIFKGAGCMIGDRAVRIEAVLTLLLTFSVVPIFQKWKPNLAAGIIKDFRWSRFLHYLLVSTFGLGIGYLSIGRPYVDVLNPINSIALLIWIIALISVFESAVLLNDLHDIRNDTVNSPFRPLTSGKISHREYEGAACLFLIASLMSASILGLHAFLLIVTMWLLAFIYSAEPFRLKNRFPLNSLVIAMESLLCFLFGLGFFAGIHTPQVLPWEVVATICMYTFFCAPIKDLKDYEGDRLAGTRTLMTVFGQEAGQSISGLLVFISLIVAPLMLGIRSLIPVGALFGIFCLVNAWRGGLTEKKAFAVYFIFAGLLGTVYLTEVRTLPMEENPLFQESAGKSAFQPLSNFKESIIRKEEK